MQKVFNLGTYVGKKKQMTNITGKFREVENFVEELILKSNALKLPITREIIKEYATQYAESKNINEFKASNGWIADTLVKKQFKGIKLERERGSYDESVIKEWKSKSLPELQKKYPVKDILNWIKLDCSTKYWVEKQLVELRKREEQKV